MTTEFRKLTDQLIEKVTLADLAKEVPCSPATIDQARLSEGAKAKRSPPPGWEKAALKLAERQIAHFTRLAAKLRSG